MMYWQCREEATGPAERGRTSPAPQHPDTEAGCREHRAQKQDENSKSSSPQDLVTEAGCREHRNRMKTVRKSSSPQDPCRYRSWRLEILGSEIGIKAIVIYQHQDTEARVL